MVNENVLAVVLTYIPGRLGAVLLFQDGDLHESICTTSGNARVIMVPRSHPVPVIEQRCLMRVCYCYYGDDRCFVLLNDCIILLPL